MIEACQVNWETWETPSISAPVISLMKMRKGVAEPFWYCQSLEKMSCHGQGWGFSGDFYVQRPGPVGARLQEQTVQLQPGSWPWRASCCWLSRQAGSGPATCIHTYLCKHTSCRIILGPCRAAPSKTYVSTGVRKHLESQNTTSAQIHI